MGLIYGYVSAVASRLIFVGHAIWSLKETIKRIHVGNEENRENSVFWTVTIIIGFIALEGTYTLIIRKGREYKFFWPTGFFYLAMMIPITCLLEIFLLEEEIKCLATQESNLKTNSTVVDQSLIKFCNLVTLTNKDDQKLRSAIEIGMLGALVVGRWLLPRGDLTRDQLSALLLTFISNGADVIEFLNTWNDFPVLRNREVIYTVLVLYSWSLFQFAVVTTKTTVEYQAAEDEVEAASTSPPVDINHNDIEGFSEDIQNQILPRKKPKYDPNLPRYVQKLMKKNPRPKLKRRDRSGTNISLKSRTSNLRSRALTDISIYSGASRGFRKQRSTTLRSRARTATSVFSAASEFQRPVGAVGRKRITFSDQSKEDDAKYFQYLAQHEQWDHFARALKQSDKTIESVKTRENSLYDPVFDDDENDSELEFNDDVTCVSRFDQDVFQTLILLFSLELPYFCARVAFTVLYNVSSITMVFYTAKNVIMMVFLVYRLWVVFSGKTEDDELSETENLE